MEIRVLLRAVVLCAIPALGLSQSLTLSGYVVDGLTNRPLLGIRMHLYAWENSDSYPLGSHGPAAAPVASDSEGRFSFAHLSRGRYALQAELAHEIYAYGESVDPFHRNTVLVTEESEGQPILFRILPRATIQVSVHDEQGDVPDYVGVLLYRRARNNGRLQMLYAGSAGVDPLGRYTFADVWPGDYLVCATPPGALLGSFAPSGASEVEYHPGGESRVYVESCFPDAKSPGALLHISSGERRDLDLKLRSAQSVTIRTNVLAGLFPANLPHMGPTIDPDTNDPESDRWQLRNVPPGSYILYAETGDRSGKDPGSVVRRPILVESAPLTLELAPEKRGSIEVHVQPSDGRTVLEGPAVWFLSSDAQTKVYYSRMTGPHTFDPGDYWLSIRPKPPFCAISQTLSGGTIRDGKITVTPGMSARLDVGLGTNCGVVDVRAVSNGDPVPFADFLLLVNGTPQEPGDVVTGSMDAHGRASIPRMPPGQYWLWAWVPSGDGYLGPDLSNAMAQAVEVVVVAGQLASVSVDPMRSPGESK
jgi:hypothetical protein